MYVRRKEENAEFARGQNETAARHVYELVLVSLLARGANAVFKSRMMLELEEAIEFRWKLGGGAM